VSSTGSPLVLGIDAGTSGLKAVLATPDGEIVGRARADYATKRPQAGHAEQDPQDWWNALVLAVRNAVADARAIPSRVAAIAVSGQGCAVTLVDGHGDIVRPAIIWMDSRAEAQSDLLRERCADEILRVNGKAPAPYNAEPSLMWLAQNEPESLERASHSLTTTGYLTFRLARTPVANVSDASICFAFDLAKRTWSEDLIEAFELPRRLYPALAECTDVVGRLSASAASDLGLESGTPVAAGGEDTSCTGLALGVVSPGEALLSLGTAGTVYVAQETIPIHARLLTFLHVVPGASLIGGSTAAVGAALEWCREAIGGGIELGQLTELAGTARPGSCGVVFLPYLSGELQPINDGRARGVFFGLSQSTSRADLVRAVMEGAAFALAHNLDVARSAGVEVAELRAAGAPTQSETWCQIIADIAGVPVSVPKRETGAQLGDALLAAKSVGLVEDLVAVARAAVGSTRTFEPNEALRDVYDRSFSLYRDLYPALETQFEAAA